MSSPIHLEKLNPTNIFLTHQTILLAFFSIASTKKKKTIMTKKKSHYLRACDWIIAWKNQKIQSYENLRHRLRSIQDNRILAELEHPRTTGPSSHVTCGITTSTMMPSNLSYTSAMNSTGTTSNVTAGIMSGLNSMGIPSSTSSHALTNFDGTISGLATSASGGVGAMSSSIGTSARASAAHQISSTMPPICQVWNQFELPFTF